MVVENPVKIVIIDDNIRKDEPFPFRLREKFGDENVIIHHTADDGLNYVFNHLSNKMVVLLDLYLGANSKEGDKVLEDIRKRTSLVSVIMMTVNRPSLTSEKLQSFINNHAVAVIESNADYKTNLPIIDKAANELSLRVDCALEEWILRHSQQEREQPYLISKKGEKYSLNQLLEEVRMGTAFGIDVQKKVLNLAVELLARQKEKL